MKQLKTRRLNSLMRLSNYLASCMRNCRIRDNPFRANFTYLARWANLANYQSSLSLAKKWGWHPPTVCALSPPSAPLMQGRTGSTLAPAEALLGITLSQISSPDFMALSSLEHCVIRCLCRKAFWNNKPA